MLPKFFKIEKHVISNILYAPLTSCLVVYQEGKWSNHQCFFKIAIVLYYYFIIIFKTWAEVFIRCKGRGDSPQFMQVRSDLIKQGLRQSAFNSFQWRCDLMMKCSQFDFQRFSVFFSFRFFQFFLTTWPENLMTWNSQRAFIWSVYLTCFVPMGYSGNVAIVAIKWWNAANLNLKDISFWTRILSPNAANLVVVVVVVVRGWKTLRLR